MSLCHASIETPLLELLLTLLPCAPHTLITVCPLQPHPASDQAAASVVASGAQTTIQLPRVQFPDDDTDGALHTYVDSWNDEPMTPVTTVYGEAPGLVRQQTFGRV